MEHQRSETNEMWRDLHDQQRQERIERQQRRLAALRRALPADAQVIAVNGEAAVLVVGRGRRLTYYPGSSRVQHRGQWTSMTPAQIVEIMSKPLAARR